MERDELKKTMGYPADINTSLADLHERSSELQTSFLDVARRDVKYLEPRAIQLFIYDGRLGTLLDYIDELIGQQEINEMTGKPVDEDAVAEAIYYLRERIDKLNQR